MRMRRLLLTLLGTTIVLAALALVSLIGTAIIERRYPQQGRSVVVAGGTLNILVLGPTDAPGLPVVLIHGASSTMGTMRVPLADELSRTRRVVLIDRPGHGWSTRDELARSSPAAQAAMIDAALEAIGVTRAIVVVHSLAGGLGALMALDHPKRVAGLIMLAPVAYPWPGGVGAYNEIVTRPVMGPLLAYTVTLPLGLLLLQAGINTVFAPQTPPPDYSDATATPLVLRPRNFLANAFDLTTLKAAITQQAPRYPQITVPTTIITGDADTIVSPDLHARHLGRVVPGATLIVLPGVGHMVQNAAPGVVIGEIEAMQARVR
jgi:pimeloyl-ACP methyl ester carboxylesterase